MSINASISAAMSGIAASARAAEVVASNIANASNETYARRELDVIARASGGIQVNGERRIADQALLADHRHAKAALGDIGTRANALTQLEKLVGLPGEAGSLPQKLGAFEASLIEAASRPDSEIRLGEVHRSAQELASGLNTAGGEVQKIRSNADRDIASAVAQLNTSLDRIVDLNRQIQSQIVTGKSPNSLIDKRQALVDGIATLVPLREMPRENGQIALFTEAGAMLLDGVAARVEFAATPMVTEALSIEGGELSGLSLNGRPVSTTDRGLFGGGKIAAHFAIRDQIAPDAQAALDALAGELILRTQLADAGSPHPSGLGLFTDAGAPWDATANPGLSRRIELNNAADPAAGGATWRLRDGLGAPAPGPGGETAQLNLLANVLGDGPVSVGGVDLGITRSVSEITGDILSRIGTAREATEIHESHAAARATALHESRLRDGVDTDAELQNLLLIERAYAANARMLQAADDMIQTLLRI